MFCFYFILPCHVFLNAAIDVYKRQAHTSRLFLLPYSLRNGSMVMAKKIVFEIIADSDCASMFLKEMEVW